MSNSATLYELLRIIDFKVKIVFYGIFWISYKYGNVVKK
jgi:hypothetical protein